MFDDLLVATDASEGATAAFTFALDLAAALDADLHLLSVVNVYELQTVPEREARDAEAREHLDELAARAADRGVDATTSLETGYPETTIHDYAASREVDLLVIGTHGRTGLDHVRLGSVAEKIVRGATVPVFTVRQDGDVPPALPERVLVATDGSECAEHAAEAGIAIATALDCPVHVLSVVEPTSLGPDVRTTEMAERDTDRAAAAVERVAERAREAGLTVTTAVVEGAAHRAVLDATEPTDCLVLGAHGQTIVTRFLLGGTTEKLIRSATVPVLTVRLD